MSRTMQVAEFPLGIRKVRLAEMARLQADGKAGHEAGNFLGQARGRPG
jgi:hypothetical protein